MNGELAAIAALAAHGSRWLSMGGAGLAPELLNTNSCYQYVGVLNVDLGRSPILGRRKTVHGTAAWLTELHRLGVDRLFLVTELATVGDLPRHLADAFANSGGWGVLAQGEQPAIWSVQWTVGDRNAPNSRIWELNATSASANGVQPTIPDVEAARSNLRSTLQEIGRFAERSGLGNWSPWFARAQALLDDADPTPPYHADILPTGSPLPLRQLAAAVVQAWVFGGMGSWNDMGPEDEAARPDYERLSRILYDAVLNGLVAATNN